MRSDYQEDDAWQRAVRDRVLKPGLYDSYWTDGRYVFVDKGRLASRLQRRCAVDTIAQGEDGEAVCVEEKIVRWPGYNYRAYSLETESCTVPGRESPGWMRYGEADVLLYCFARQRVLDWHMIAFPPLKAWFAQHEEAFDTFGPLETLNRSAGRLVPLGPVSQLFLLDSGCIYPDLTDPVTAELFRSRPRYQRLPPAFPPAEKGSLTL